METFSVLLGICVRTQRPMTRSFGVFFYLRLNKRLSKQSRDWWFKPPSHHYDVTVMIQLSEKIGSQWLSLYLLYLQPAMYSAYAVVLLTLSGRHYGHLKPLSWEMCRQKYKIFVKCCSKCVDEWLYFSIFYSANDIKFLYPHTSRLNKRLSKNMAGVRMVVFSFKLV